MEEWMRVVWLVIFVITMIVEVSVPDLVSIWFAIAAIITLGLSFIDGLPWWGQIVIFVGLSLILLAITRKFVRKFLRKKETAKTNLDTLIGKEYVVRKQIEPNSKGEIVVNGVTWDCETGDNSIVEVGKVVVVIRLEGNKLIVEEKK